MKHEGGGEDSRQSAGERLGPGEYLLAGLFAVTILVVAAQVLWRYGFNSSLSWTEEVSGYTFTWLIFLGAALVIKDHAHVAVRILVDHLPPGIRKWIDLLNALLILSTFVMLVVLGFMLVARTSGTLSPALKLPVNCVFYAALPVTGLVAIYYALRRLIAAVRELNAPVAEDG